VTCIERRSLLNHFFRAVLYAAYAIEILLVAVDR
jgi:hypothetical protein